jgi:hypothetical protein
MDTIPPAADAQNLGNGERFHVRCEAGDDNRFRVTTESLTVTVGQRVLREGTLEMWDSVSIYAKGIKTATWSLRFSCSTRIGTSLFE